MVAPWVKKPCRMGSKYTCQIWQNYGKKIPKNARSWPYIIKTAPILADGSVFLKFWHQLVILKGCNMAEFCKQQPVQNSAPNVRKLPGKPLKMLLTHQNDHRGRKRGKVAFLEFNFEHFKGYDGRFLEASGFYPGGSVTHSMDLVFDGASGAPHPDAHQKTAPRGGD